MDKSGPDRAAREVDLAQRPTERVGVRIAQQGVAGYSRNVATRGSREATRIAQELRHHARGHAQELVAGENGIPENEVRDRRGLGSRSARRDRRGGQGGAETKTHDPDVLDAGQGLELFQRLKNVFTPGARPPSAESPEESPSPR